MFVKNKRRIPLLSVAPTAVSIVEPGVGGLVVGRKYDISCRAWGSRPPASLTWYLGTTRLGREYITKYLGRQTAN